MKILVDTYSTAFQNKAGGVHNRIIQTVNSIRDAGVSLDYFDKYTSNIENYDLLHVFKLNIENYSLIKLAKAKGKKVVVSAVVNLFGEFQLKLYWKLRKLPIMTTYKILFEICKIADAIIVETRKEARFINRYYHVIADKIYVIGNGVSLMQCDNEIIYKVMGKKCDYVLVVGRFDKNKNQLNVVRAFKNTDTEIVFIGGEDPIEKKYYYQCTTEAEHSANIHFLGWVDSNDILIKSAFTHAKVLLAPSFNETFGLTIIEGVTAGAIPVISERLPILEYSSLHSCLRCKPESPKDIFEKVTIAMNMKNSDDLKNKVSSEFSWENIAKQHIELYRGLCQNEFKNKD